MASCRPPLSVFRGYNRGEIAEFWIEKFENYVKGYSLINSEALTTFRCHLDEDATVWFLTLDESIKSSFVELKKSFFENFSKIHIRPVSLKMEMTSRVQAPDESIEHYFWDKRCLLLQCCIQEEEELVNNLISGFIPIIRESFETFSAKTCEEVKQHAREIYDEIAIPSGKTGRYKPDNNDINVTGVGGGSVAGNANVAGYVHGDVGSVYYYVYLVVSRDEGEQLISGDPLEQIKEKIKDVLKNPGDDTDDPCADVLTRPLLDEEGELSDIAKRPTLDEEGMLQDVLISQEFDDGGAEDSDEQDIKETSNDQDSHQEYIRKPAISPLPSYPEYVTDLDFKMFSKISSHEKEARTQWIPDEEAEYCMVCEKTKFNFIRRKHHCRMCKKVICDGCSITKLPKTVKHYKRLCSRCISLSPVT